MTRNIIFLLDSSRSMNEQIGATTKFQLAIQAIKKVITNPNPERTEDTLSVILCWTELLKGFQKEVLYKDVPMSVYVSPQKLNQFSEAKNNAYTSVDRGIEYAIQFLLGKDGDKVIKLITDGVGVEPLRVDYLTSELQKNSIQFDCIMIGDEGKQENLKRIVQNLGTGRFSIVFTIESLVNALQTI
ncbi:MAG: vWA domain-containing protein [Candidatus Jordarchaeaceae archaeon]